MKFENVATAVNKAADPIPFNAVVYTMNHGESLRSKKNRGRVWELSLRNLLWPSYANAILAQDFSSPDLA